MLAARYDVVSVVRPGRVLWLAVVALFLLTGQTHAAPTPLDDALRAAEPVERPSGNRPAAPTDSHAAHEHEPSRAELPSHEEPNDWQAAATGNPLTAFVASWKLFKYSYLEGWLVGLMLALVGVVVVARDQIFIGTAVSEASALGIAVVLSVGSVFPTHSAETGHDHSPSWICCDTMQVVMAVAFSVMAALLTAWADRARRESHEAITGWIFLVASALSVLVVAHSPTGLEEIHRIHSSSLIGATASDVVLFGSLLAATIVFLVVGHDRLLLFIVDPSMASSVGMSLGRWSSFVSVWLGLSVGLSIRATGVLFTLGSLVLPALVAKNLCREVHPMFWIAPIVSVVTNTIGFVLANRYDFPPAQMNVALACAALLVAWCYRSIRRCAGHS